MCVRDTRAWVASTNESDLNYCMVIVSCWPNIAVNKKTMPENKCIMIETDGRTHTHTHTHTRGLLQSEPWHSRKTRKHERTRAPSRLSRRSAQHKEKECNRTSWQKRANKGRHTHTHDTHTTHTHTHSVACRPFLLHARHECVARDSADKTWR